MGILIDKIKLIIIKKEFNKIYNLVLENTNRTDKKSFSDGTPYTEAELNKRMVNIGERVANLRVYPNELGLLRALANHKVGFLELGAERLIQLYNREPIFMQNAIIFNFKNFNVFKVFFFKVESINRGNNCLSFVANCV